MLRVVQAILREQLCYHGVAKRLLPIDCGVGAERHSLEEIQQLRRNLHHRSTGTSLALKSFGESKTLAQRNPTSSSRSAQCQRSSLRYIQARLGAEPKIDLSKMDRDLRAGCHTDLRCDCRRGAAAKKSLADRVPIFNVPRRLCALV